MALTPESHFIGRLWTEGVKHPKTADRWLVKSSVCRDLAPFLTLFNQISRIVYEISHILDADIAEWILSLTNLLSQL